MDYCIILVVLSTILYGANTYFTKKNDLKALEEEVKEQALQLFLFGEKQGWIGEEKMNYACNKIYELIDKGIIAKVIKEQTIKDWMQNLYNSVKDNLKKISE